MTSISPAQKEDNLQTISELIEISQLDTLYRDLYLQTARQLMEPVLSFDTYNHIRDSLDTLPLVERQLRAAVQRGDWKRSTELTERIKSIKASADKGSTLDMAEAVYDKLSDVPVDPFAPGFYAILGNSADTLKSWRSRAVETLSFLATDDPTNKDFYAKRRTNFEGLAIGEQVQEKKKSATSVDLRQDALNAVDSGDLAALESIIQKLGEKKDVSNEDGSPEVELSKSGELGDDLNYEFSDTTLDAAGKFGMSHIRTSSRRQFEYLIPYGWSPSYLKSESKRWAKDQVSRLTHPGRDSDAAKEAIELYLFNPLINSGGTRYQVCMVEEDMLIEDFPEPEPRTEMPDSKLLDSLGLANRWGRTRLEIEKALLSNGPRVLKEGLGLDPREFRLVAVPPDIFTLLGSELGWGQQEMWTHFDGYWVQEGSKLQALAGGDKRFGGTHDVVAFSPNYSSDKLLVRFAVVQRKRMMSWQRP